MLDSIKNKQIALAKRPNGLPGADCWTFRESSLQKPSQGQVVVRVIYVSVDPAMRGWLNDAKSYIPPVAIDETMRAIAVGQVVESNSDDYDAGDYVCGIFGVQEYATVTADASMYKVDPSVAPLTAYMGVLGMPGMTAYFGLLDVGEPKEGETVLISGAAGAVGALVGQIAKVKGCRVVGIAGGSEKCDYLVNELGFDAAIDYKSESDLSSAIASACPKGIDIFFDNVGGEILDATLGCLRQKARIVICGAISQYNNEGGIKAKIDYMPLLVSSARLEGFVVLNYVDRYPEGIAKMAEWLMGGKLLAKEDVYQGVENYPEVLLKLFKGENFGKLVLQVGEEKV